MARNAGRASRPRRRTLAILGAMGFNPDKKRNATPADYAMVAAAFVVVVALVAWGFFGGKL